MRITSVSLQTNGTDILKGSLVRTDTKSRYLVKKIEGLDAPDLVPKFYGAGLATGKRFHEFVSLPKEVVMRLALNPNFSMFESYGSVRDQIYRAVSSSRDGLVDILFHDGGAVVAKLSGFIIKVESDPFVKDPETLVTISCKDGILRGVIPTVKDVSEIVSGTEEITLSDSSSTAPHGFTFAVDFTDAEASFVVEDLTDSDWAFVVEIPGGFLNGDRLVFSSEVNNTQLYLIRSAVTTHLMDAVFPGSVWPILFPGDNHFFFEQADSFDWVSINWYTAYWGV